MTVFTQYQIGWRKTSENEEGAKVFIGNFSYIIKENNYRKQVVNIYKPGLFQKKLLIPIFH